MATMSNQRASSSASSSSILGGASSSPISQEVYDVFLSFFGEDTRKNFTDHLYATMKHKGINVFRDDEELKRGNNISNELSSAIEVSQYAVVVISENYAFSKWCLMELTKIVECSREKQLKLLPIFYHVDPSNVRKQRGSFARALVKHEGNPNIDENQRTTWRAVLGEVGTLAGWHVYDRYESSIVEEICATILDGLLANLPNIFNDLVGLESQVKEMMDLLSITDKNVLFIGIFGMGGIGKTTLAKVIHDSIFSQFEANCFVEEINEQAKNLGIVKLQEELIHQILKERKKIGSMHEGMKVIAKSVQHKKTLIVLDNVETEEPLKALISSHNWFKEGSRVLITSRDSHLLKRFVNKTYEVQPLNECDALKLFSLKAFKKDYPEEIYMKLSKDIVNYARGLPLALEVFGSFLFSRTIEQWKHAQDYLKANPNAKIIDKLRISFDDLEYLEKELFLDIAFFFNGRQYGCGVINALTSLGYEPIINIEVLKDKSLIKIFKGGRIWMHDLLAKMGHQIVYHESPNEPNKRSRLCYSKDIIHLLKNDTVTNAVKGIAVNFSLPEWEQLNLNAFSMMKSLRILKISHDGEDFHSLKCHQQISKFTLSNNLRVLRWKGYPSEFLLFDSPPHNLVELEISQSHIKLLWDTSKCLEKLTCIELHELEYLIELPDLSTVPNIVELKAIKCKRLSKVHSSIGFLKQLRQLSIWDCEMLNKLPNKISLPALRHLSIHHCPKLNYFPNIVDEIPKNVNGMEHLEVFTISGTAIRQLPSFLLFSTKLLSLGVTGSSSSPISFELPNSISSLRSLKWLSLSYCNLSYEALPSNFGYLSSLKSLRLNGNRFTSIPPSVLFPNLEYLYVAGIRSLQTLIITPPVHLRCLTTQESLSYLPSTKLLTISGGKFTRISDNISEIPTDSLYLKDCSGLQLLPKLPFQLRDLHLNNCLSLEMLGYDEMDAWILSEMLDIGDLSFMGIYFGNGSKPYRILYLSSQNPIWTEKWRVFIDNTISWGPTLESKVPVWYSQRRSSVSGMLQSHLSFNRTYGLKGYALFVVYEVHEDGNSSFRAVNGNNPIFPRFVCRLHVNKSRSRFRLHFRVPEVRRVGLNGSWVFISSSFFRQEQRDLWESADIGDPSDPRDLREYWGVSIETNNKNVELKECGAHLAFEGDDEEFSGVLSSISLHGFDDRSVMSLSSSLLIYGPIKGKKKSRVVQLEENQFLSNLNCSEHVDYRNQGVSSTSEYIKVMLQTSFKFLALFLHKVCYWSQEENTNV